MRWFPLISAVPFAAVLLAAPATAAGESTYGSRIDSALSRASQEIGGDAGKALAWVESATDYEPYRGALRGARGAYVTGRANSVDQALLLQAVLKPAASRFASCTLSEADASALADAPAAQAPSLLVEKAAALAEGESDARTKDYLGQLGTAWAALTATHVQESAALADAATQAGIVFGGPDTTLARREAASAHAWLQVQVGDAWTDLDPTLAGAQPGQKRCEPALTFETLPAELMHRVTLSVVAEIRTEAGVERREVARLDSDAATLGFDDTMLFFAEAQGAKTDADAEAVKAGAFAYTPVLRVGAADTLGTPFLVPSPKSGFGAVGGSEKIGGATDVIGGLGEPEPAPDSEAPSALPEEAVAAFLEITLTSPDEAPATAIATIFDRIGPALRAANQGNFLKPLPETEGDYADLARVWDIGVLSGAAMRRLEEGPRALVGADIFGQARVLAGSVRSFEVIEGALLRAAGLAPLTTHKRPRLLLLGFGPSGQGEKGRAAFIADLAASAIEDAPDARETVAERASRAVARVLAERIVAGAAGLPALGLVHDAQPEVSADLLALAAAARTQGAAFGTTLPNFDDPDATTLAAQHVADGRIVLAPAGSVDLGGQRLAGWWVADAQAGLFYDELGDGRSTESAEYTETGEPARQSVPAWQRHACAIRRSVMAASVVIGLITFDPSAGVGGNAFLGLADEMHAAEEAAEQAAEEAASTPGRDSGAGCG